MKNQKMKRDIPWDPKINNLDHSLPHHYEFLKLLKQNDRYLNIGSVLNVGMNCDSGKLSQKDILEIVFFDELGVYDIDVTVVEAFAPYCENGPKKYPEFNFVNCDVVEVDKYVHRKFDLVLWWHGPEHIKEEFLVPTIKKLERLSNKYVVLGSPEGWHEQGSDRDNHFDSHLSGPDSAFYRSLGYESYWVMDPVFKSTLAFKEIL
jgi:hypothetical protein